MFDFSSTINHWPEAIHSNSKRAFLHPPIVRLPAIPLPLTGNALRDEATLRNCPPLAGDSDKRGAPPAGQLFIVHYSLK